MGSIVTIIAAKAIMYSALLVLQKHQMVTIPEATAAGIDCNPSCSQFGTATIRGHRIAEACRRRIEA